MLAPSVTRRTVVEFAKRPVPKNNENELESLTEREIDVMKLVARGKINDEISHNLFISEATVRTRVSNLLAKLSLRDRVQVVVFAYENGVE